MQMCPARSTGSRCMESCAARWKSSNSSPGSRRSPFAISRSREKKNYSCTPRLVERFRRTSFAIPAPFSSLRGPIELLVGDVHRDLEGASVPLKFDTDLKAPEQAIVTATSGRLEYVPDTGALKVNGETHIKWI